MDIICDGHVSGLESSCCSAHPGSFKKGPGMEGFTVGMEKGISLYLSDLSCSQESYQALPSPTPIALLCQRDCLLLCHLSFSEHHNCSPYGSNNVLAAFCFSSWYSAHLCTLISTRILFYT